jgi:long-chain acyl-CoA synthetase
VKGGGMAVQKPVADRRRSVTRVVIYDGYGLCQTSPVITANLFDATACIGTIGLPLPFIEIATRDDDRRDQPPGTAGEICIRGPQRMQGYWNRPGETADAMTADGFFRSRHISVDDSRGHLRILDRKKDIILVSGFNVYPKEVAALHSEIVEVAVAGVLDNRAGKAVKLLVVPRRADLTEAEVRAHCAGGLTNDKPPRHIAFLSELPKLAVGKFFRRNLKATG